MTDGEASEQDRPGGHVDEPTSPDEAPAGAAPADPTPADPTLAAVALGLGIAALVVGLVPYLLWVSLPLAVAAVVLGALSWSGPGRVHAVVGAVTGAVAIVVVLAWVALLTAGWSPLPLAGLPDLTAPEAEVALEPPAAAPDDVAPDEAPPDEGPDPAPEPAPGGGVATIEFDGAPRVIELDDCVVVVDEDELHAEAVGPDGSVMLRATLAEVALTAVTGPERATRLLGGAPEDVAIERTERGVRLAGPLDDLGTGQRVDTRLEIDCG